MNHFPDYPYMYSNVQHMKNNDFCPITYMFNILDNSTSKDMTDIKESSEMEGIQDSSETSNVSKEEEETNGNAGKDKVMVICVKLFIFAFPILPKKTAVDS